MSKTSMKRDADVAETRRTASPSMWETVNRVVFPVKDQDLTLPLYAIEWTRPHLPEQVFNPPIDLKRLNLSKQSLTGFQRMVDDGITRHADTDSNDVFTVGSRRSITVKAGHRVSLCTFFNAFPASYWRRWTNVGSIRLSLKAQGKGSVIVFKSNGRGLFSPITTLGVDSSARVTRIETILPLKGFIDGGYYWFDVKADDDAPLTISDAEWDAPVAARRAHAGDAGKTTTASIAITTFNRPSYCHDQLKAIAADDNLRRRLDTIYCVDQGTDLVRDQPGFADTARALGGQLTYVRQANLGGSGGYSRGMYETLRAGSSDYVQLLDDDAISEPESIIRAINFADYTRKPTIVGGGMFHIDNRTILLTLGEHWDPHSNMHGAIPGRPYNHDFAKHPLIESPEWHQRLEADYNAWWMCLIPTEVIRKIGLGLPLFIKHDDIEFGLRARRHGFRTVALPGVAVWHQAWHDKDPLRTWEEYFVLRNRWIQGLLYCDKPMPRFLREMVAGDVNAGCKLTYSAMKLRNMAMRDLMRGPQYIIDTMPTIISTVRKAREGFADSTVISDLDSVPEPEHTFAAPNGRWTSLGFRAELVRTFARNLFGRGSGVNDERPQVEIPYKDVFWMSFRGVNSALVTTPDGDNVEWFRRDSDLYRRMFMSNLKLYGELLKNWDRYSRMYRSCNMSSPKVWEKIFAQACIDE